MHSCGIPMAMLLLLICFGCRDAEIATEHTDHIKHDCVPIGSTDVADAESASPTDDSRSEPITNAPLPLQASNDGLAVKERAYEHFRDEMSAGFPITAGMSLERVHAIMDSERVVVTRGRTIEFQFRKDRKDPRLLWAHVVRSDHSSGSSLQGWCQIRHNGSTVESIWIQFGSFEFPYGPVLLLGS